MARKSFEVVSLKFIFNSYGTTDTEKEHFVREGLNKYLKLFCSKITLKSCCSFLEKGDFIVNAEFSKELEFTTVINILGQMYEDTGNMLSIAYGEITKIVTVSILS